MGNSALSLWWSRLTLADHLDHNVFGGLAELTVTFDLLQAKAGDSDLPKTLEYGISGCLALLASFEEWGALKACF